MNTLTLIPLGSSYVNPAEIAAIRPEGSDKSYIMIKGNPVAIQLNLSVEAVIERLQSHFEPPLNLPQDVGAAVDVAKILAPYFPQYAPTTLADGVSQLVTTMRGSR